MTRGIERTFSRPFSETFRISKNEDFSGPYLENKNEFLKNSFETVFRASKSCDRGRLVSAFQLTFKENNFDIVALSKTFLTKKIDFKIQGYGTIKNDCSTGARGGVAFLIKHGLVINKKILQHRF